MKLPHTLKPLDASQVDLVLEMLDTRTLAPKETAARFYQLCSSKAFSAAQQDAIELLFELEDDELAAALMAFADEEARDLVREQLAYEALGFVAA
ncbi:MAG: hypothetical protein ABWZ88_19060 [Variovorax sp.]